MARITAKKVAVLRRNARKPAASRSSPGYILNAAARILTWYAIFVLVFRCPSTLDQCDAVSPRICKAYFQVKGAVAPHIQKHYDAYAAPYVQVVRPYYDTVDRVAIGPAWTYAVKHGAPQAARAQAFGTAQWHKNVRPQLAKAQDAAGKQYSQVLGPHVDKVVAMVAPYYEIARSSALQTHHELLLPAYRFLSPYALRGYSAASTFTTGTAVPAAVWTYHAASAFVDANVLPRLRVIYQDTVEPQLEKIGQRLGRSSDKAQHSTLHRTVYSAAPSSFTKPAQPSTSTTSIKASASVETKSESIAATVSIVSATSSAPSDTPPVATEAPKLKRPDPIIQDQAEPDEDAQRRSAREEVAEDLRAWQEKYAKAADEGAAEIEKRVEDISKRMIRRNARTKGKALVDDLQETVVSNLAQLRRDIVDIVGTVVRDSATGEEATEQVWAVVRRAGLGIKERAQAVRSWRDEYSKELQDTVARAAENHFQILGGIRDLALQRIGMKWAWMEGVTYKDWAKYHQLKGRFDEWENDLEQLIVTHPGLEEAQNIGQALEDEAMTVAQAAAKELARLREVAILKVDLGDDSDEFDADTIKANAEAAEAARIAAEKAAEEAAAEAAAAEAAAAEAAASAEAATPDVSENSEEDEGVSGSDASEDADVPGATTETSADAEAEDAVGEADAAANTIAPEEVPVVLGEAGAVIEDTPSLETTQPEQPVLEDDTVEEAQVHLPVDEVVAADDVPLDVGSSVSGATGAETTASSATPAADTETAVPEHEEL